VTPGTRCIYRYRLALHASDGRDNALLMARSGQAVTVRRYWDGSHLVLVHDARGRDFYAHCNELQPIATNQTPAGVQEELKL